MMYFSLPADFKEETIIGYSKLNQKFKDKSIFETYGQITTNKTFAGSGRHFDLLPKTDLKKLEKYIYISRKSNIKFNYTLNTSCLSNFEFSKTGIYELKNFLKVLYNIGIDTITVSLPSVIEIIKSLNCDLEIKASAICNVLTPDKANHYKSIGINRIVLGTDITRDFLAIRNICNSFGDGIEIIINSLCHKNCPYKMFHYNHESHSANSEQDITNYYFHRCNILKTKELNGVMRLNWIRPEDLNLYSKCGVNHFKIQGRNIVYKGDPVRAIEYYMKEDFDGNLYELLTLFFPINMYQPYISNKKLNGFFNKFLNEPNFCKNMCEKCGYCESFARKSTNFENGVSPIYNYYKNLETMNSQVYSFYNENDNYIKAIKDHVQKTEK